MPRNRHTRLLFALVDAAGVEPAVPFGRRIYSPLGLPIFLHIQIFMVSNLTSTRSRRIGLVDKPRNDYHIETHLATLILANSQW
jgi:hypothetical protein